MPELPEVETIAAGVNESIRGEKIAAVWLGSRREPFKTPAAEMSAGLAGKRVAGVRRVGKHIVFDLEGTGDLESAGPAKRRQSAKKTTARAEGSAAAIQAQWIVHLGMTGRLLVCGPETPEPPHTHAVLSLSSGRELRFVDPRRFGRLAYRVLGEGADGAGFRGPGTEPLTVTDEGFAALFRGRRSPIKSALLNQKLLHGVGNIYADESLFRAGIRPKRLAGRLTRAELAALRLCLVEVLRQAIAQGGSSISDYVNADGEGGLFQVEHRVYGRAGQPCLICGGPVRRIVLGGRSTHYCPRCQH